MTGMYNLKGLSRKLVAGQDYVCILLEIGWVQTGTDTVSNAPELFVANAIQMNCSEGERCFRYNRDVFGVLLPLPEGLEPERLREEWLMRFNAFIELVRQSDTHQEKPVLRIFYDRYQPPEEGAREALEQLVEPHLHQNQLAPTVKGGLGQQLEEIRRQIIRSPAQEWTMERSADLQYPQFRRSGHRRWQDFKRRYQTGTQTIVNHAPLFPCAGSRTAGHSFFLQKWLQNEMKYDIIKHIHIL